MIFMMVAAFGVTTLLTFQKNVHKLNHRSFEGNKALYLAEAGIHVAIHELNSQANPFTGTGPFLWTNAGNVYSLTLTDIGSVAISVDMTNQPTDVIIQSRATYQDTQRSVEVRTAKSILSDFNPNAAAVASISDLDLNNSFETDSYSGGVYTLATRGYNGHVFSQASNVVLKGGSIIRGHLLGNPGATFETGAPSRGEVYWDSADDLPAPTTNRGGQTQTIETFAPAVVPPHLQMSGTPTVTLTSGGTYPSGHYLGATNLSDITFSGGFYKITGSVGIKSNKNWTLTGNCDIYVTGDVSFGNGAELINYVPATPVVTVYTVRLFVDGDISFAQGSAVNVNSNFTPSHFQIYGTGPLLSPRRTIDIKNSSVFMGFLYAPNYKVILANTSHAYGSFSVYVITPKNGAFIHFDERLWNFSVAAPLGKYPITNWREI
jgi:hypothetical protein